jgi:predicted AAA+ superfamily ATPase
MRNMQEFFTSNEKNLVVIDEVQRMPELFPVLRAVIDRHRKSGRFLLLGSASPEVLRHSSETLAGRIVYTELTPFTLPEVIHKKSQQHLWVRGGFPLAFLAKNSEVQIQWQKSFLTTYIERDLRNLGLQASPEILMKLLTMLAHNQGQEQHYSQYAASLGISVPTVTRYIDYFENSFILRKLSPFFFNSKKRLVKSPRLYIRDAGLLHYLLHIKSYNDLLKHPVAGFSWEGFVIEQIISTLKDKYQYAFYRTQDGSECDLVIMKANKPVWCVEVKLSDAPSLAKGFYFSVADLKPKHSFIITPSNKASFSVSKGVTVCGLEEFLRAYVN